MKNASNKLGSLDPESFDGFSFLEVIMGLLMISGMLIAALSFWSGLMRMNQAESETWNDVRAGLAMSMRVRNLLWEEKSNERSLDPCLGKETSHGVTESPSRVTESSLSVGSRGLGKLNIEIEYVPNGSRPGLYWRERPGKNYFWMSNFRTWAVHMSEHEVDIDYSLWSWPSPFHVMYRR